MISAWWNTCNQWHGETDAESGNRPSHTNKPWPDNKHTHLRFRFCAICCLTSSFLVHYSLLLKHMVDHVHMQPNLFLNVLIVLINTWKLGGIMESPVLPPRILYVGTMGQKLLNAGSSRHLELITFSASSDIRNGHQVPLSHTKKMHFQHFQPYCHYYESSLDKTNCKLTRKAN